MPNTIQKIATLIADRGTAQGWKPGTKTADNLNIEIWIGAYIGLYVAEHEDAEWCLQMLSMVMQVRGYRETLHIVHNIDENPL